MKRNNQPAKDQWFTPGGRILLGETLEEAVQRVLHEETGLTAVRTEKKGAMSHIWPTTHAVTVYYHIEAADDDVEMNDEHSAYRWITEISEDLHPYLKEMIEESGVL